MAKISLASVARHCDRLLRTDDFGDWEGAVNGLQVENCGTITRVAAAVDASLATVKLAVAAKADLMIVHHGLFWSPSHPWTGKRHELLRLVLENNRAVYSSHLPLDAHPRLGNNAQLCAALGLKKLKPFFFEKCQFIGYKAEARLKREELAGRLQRALGGLPTLAPGGPSLCRRIGVVTGGGGSGLEKGAREGGGTIINRGRAPLTVFFREGLRGDEFFVGHHAPVTSFG